MYNNNNNNINNINNNNNTNKNNHISNNISNNNTCMYMLTVTLTHASMYTDRSVTQYTHATHIHKHMYMHTQAHVPCISYHMYVESV